MSFDMSKLLEEIEAEATKTASAQIPQDDPMMKVAEDLFAGGRMFAKGFIAELQKAAAEGGKVEPSTGDASNDKSVFKQVATAIQSRQGAGPASPTVGSSGTGGTTEKKIQGDNPGVVYDAVAPKQQERPHAERHGNV